MSAHAHGRPFRDAAPTCVTGSQYEQMADVRVGAQRRNLHLCVLRRRPAPPHTPPLSHFTSTIRTKSKCMSPLSDLANHSLSAAQTGGFEAEISEIRNC